MHHHIIELTQKCSNIYSTSVEKQTHNQVKEEIHSVRFRRCCRYSKNELLEYCVIWKAMNVSTRKKMWLCTETLRSDAHYASRSLKCFPMQIIASTKRSTQVKKN